MDKKPYGLGLTIGHKGKGVPYGGLGEVRPDGTANHGFRNLKGNPERLAQIPELKEDLALRQLIAGINGPRNGLASVGCANWQEADKNGHRRFGYVEFAINTVEAVSDASNYFPLFFHFDRMLHNVGFAEVVNYQWELEPAHFLTTRSDGFTCAVWIRLPARPTSHEAEDGWRAALDPLTTFLGGYPIQTGQPLFIPED